MQLSPKAVSAYRLIGFNLANWKVSGDTVGTPIVGDWSSTPSGLTFSAPSLVGDQAQVLVTGGAAGTEYVIALAVTMSPSGEQETFKATMKVVSD